MANILIALGHGRSRTGAWDPGAHGNGTTEADWLRGPFLKSLKKYAGNKIDFYEQNMFANRDANTIKKYDQIIELHLDAASAAAKGGHVIIYKGYKPDALDNRLGATIKKHFGLRGGKMFDGRSNLYNLNTFARRKVSYRLLELGFITNKSNMDHFKANYDVIAKELIEDILNTKIETVQPASSTVSNYLSEGDTGTAIEQLQKDLNAAGFDLTVDGRFGKATKEAVLKFQLRTSLERDGIVGDSTRAKLAQVIDRQEPEVKPASINEEEITMADLLKLTTNEGKNAQLRVLRRFEKKDPALATLWREKAQNGEFTVHDGLEIMFVAIDRGYITGLVDTEDLAERVEALESDDHS